jgi:enoyl-CoA hydratase/carnithine racemase
MSDVIAQIEGRIGCLTLNRPKALNALSLDMVRSITAALLAWQNDPQVLAVAVRGSNKEGPFGAFCAGETSGFSTRLPRQGTLDWKTFSPKSTN